MEGLALVVMLHEPENDHADEDEERSKLLNDVKRVSIAMAHVHDYAV
jgi:hypothetical protein